MNTGTLAPPAGPGVIGLPPIPSPEELGEWIGNLGPWGREKAEEKKKAEAERKKKLAGLTGKGNGGGTAAAFTPTKAFV